MFQTSNVWLINLKTNYSLSYTYGLRIEYKPCITYKSFKTNNKSKKHFTSYFSSRTEILTTSLMSSTRTPLNDTTFRSFTILCFILLSLLCLFYGGLGCYYSHTVSLGPRLTLSSVAGSDIVKLVILLHHNPILGLIYYV